MTKIYIRKAKICILESLWNRSVPLLASNTVLMMMFCVSLLSSRRCCAGFIHYPRNLSIWKTSVSESRGSSANQCKLPLLLMKRKGFARSKQGNFVCSIHSSKLFQNPKSGDEIINNTDNYVRDDDQVMRVFDEDGDSLIMDEEQMKLESKKMFGVVEGDVARGIENAKTLDEYLEVIESYDEGKRNFLRNAASGQDVSSFSGSKSIQEMDPEDALSLIQSRQLFVSRRVTLLADQVVNLASAKQVAEILYGDSAGGSTDRYTLETRFGDNEIAKEVLRWRELETMRRRTLNRVKKKKKKYENETPYERARREHRSKHVRVDEQSSRSFSTASTNALSFKSKGNEIKEEPLILIDISGYIFRAYYAMPPLHRSDGAPVGAVLGVCNMLIRIVLNKLLAGKTQRVVIVYDSPGKNFRHHIYKEYKANRSECPEDLAPQFDFVRKAVNAFGIRQVQANGYEADDVIATLATLSNKNGTNVDIYTSDKDLMQLCTPM